MLNKKKLSIIVLTYNHQDFITKAIEGVFMQKVNFPIELIICDDKSPDNTDKVIKSLIENTPSSIEVKYTQHSINKGATPNFYYALEQVTGDYIAFCEGDDYWTDENKLQTQYDFLEENREYSICFHQAMNISPYPEIDNTLFSIVEDRDYTPLEIYQHWIVHTATVMMIAATLKTEAFKNTLKDTTLLYFDTALFLVASTLGKIRGFSKTMSVYRRHDLGLSFGKVNVKRDLKHNYLDEIIGNYYGGKIKQHSEWQILKRSYEGFNLSLKKVDIGTSFRFLYWMLRYYKKLIVFLIKK